MPTIDLNSDVGEGFGLWKMGDDEAIMPFVTSANIACGMHAGDPSVIARTVALAKRHGVAVGAHPGYADLQGFGRRAMSISLEQVGHLILYQVGAVKAIANAKGAPLRHVKVHGALYNEAAKSALLAQAICRAVQSVDPTLIVYGLAGSAWIEAAKVIGLRVLQEAFADRSYQDDGSLTPRTQPGALIEDPTAASEQAIRLARDHTAIALSGSCITVHAQTLCLHGDQPGAAEFARVIGDKLAQAGITLAAPDAGAQFPKNG